MASCSEQDVRDRIQTELAQAVVLRLIDEADDELTDLGGGALDAGQKKRACSMLTAEIIAQRYPQSYKIGGMSVTNPADYALTFRRGALKVIRRSSGIGGLRAVDPLAEG